MTGFTLVDLMLTVVIVVILGSIAITSYSAYATKSRMAEAYTGINKMTKDQTAYYLENKSFHWASANPGVRLYQDGPSKNKMYSSSIDGISYRSGFDTVRFPFSPGAKVNFNDEVNSARTDGSANDITTYCPGSGCNFAITRDSARIPGWYLPAGSMGMTGCSNTLLLTDFKDLTGKALYSWAMLMASRDFNTDNVNCTVLFRIMDTDSRGIVNTANPIQTLNVGD